MSTTAIKQYNVFHPKGGKLNHQCDINMLSYEFAASVLAENLVRSFYMAQNDFNPLYQQYNVRSTCVGDIISDGNEVYMVMGSNYKRINTKHQLFKNIRSLNSDVPAIHLEEPLNEDDIDELIENSY